MGRPWRPRRVSAQREAPPPEAVAEYALSRVRATLSPRLVPISRILILVLATVVVACFFYFDVDSIFTLDYIQQRYTDAREFVRAQPIEAAASFFIVYLLIAALSLPGAALLSLLGGGLFGLVWGTIIVSFASTLGATAAFLLSRYLFRDAVSRRFAKQMATINRGIDADGAFYLFTLRLIPVFPFFVINLLMGLTSIATLTFLLVSQIGMLPATLVFVNAGKQLAQLDSLGAVLSPALLMSFVLLGLFPLLAKSLVGRMKRYKALRGYAKPRKFDRNLIVIGAGSAGLVAAYIAAATKASVTLIEKHRMGGDCLNTGCIPSKALLRSAKAAHHARHNTEFGLAQSDVEVSFAEVMARVRRVIEQVAPHDSIERYTKLGVECLRGDARIHDPYRVEVDGRVLTTRNIVVAAGASPLVPPIPGLSDVDYLTSDTLWDLRELPAKLLVLGGGPIGCELGQAFARLGSDVTLLEMAPRLLLREDETVSAAVQDALENDGVNVALHHRATKFYRRDVQQFVACEVSSSPGANKIELSFDVLIVALGRRANTSGYGLEELGITLSEDGTIATDAFLATNIPTIYACGDVAGPYQFTHTASHQAWYATINSLFGSLKRFTANYSAVPWCTFTDPEVARVGLNETEAQAQGIGYELTEFDIQDLDRALADGVATGCVRVLTPPGKDRILGVSIVGEQAGDLIAEFVLAMTHGLGLKKILSTIHIYPTLAEANKFAAGAWQREHAPEFLLRLAARFHRARRGI